MHDVEVRVGSTPPGGGPPAAGRPPSATPNPRSINARCTLHVGQLGTKRGQRVRLACGRPLLGRYVTLQIR
jgi:hypothetical protein